MNAPAEMAVAQCAQALNALLEKQRRGFARERYPSLDARRDRLARIVRIVKQHEGALVAAVDRDFGHRASQETRLAEIAFVLAEAQSAIRRLPEWMKAIRVRTPLHLRPATARIMLQPIGVVGVISPWNYPIQLALAPVVAALAAGNRVMLKPSELAPATSSLLAELVAMHFRDDEWAVVTGDEQVGAIFASLPFDHLLFTGSASVGRRVAAAAAANLTPVTLELGGKSPALFDIDADFARGTRRLIMGKALNAGQSCIAPDYALVPKPRVDEFVRAMKAAVQSMYPATANNPDYTSIVDTRHYARLIRLLEDARSRGAHIVALGDASHGDSDFPRRLAPTLVLDVTDDMAIMREEVFGPLLPVETYTTQDDAIARINARPAPLALYWFGDDRAHRERVLRETKSGGVTVNDTLWHFAHDGLPFGGVGESGSGAYHGEFGFARFSNQKPVYRQSPLAVARFLEPPYGAMFERALALVRRRCA
jgi:coniferyl-aldehyde dehydrogenase